MRIGLDDYEQAYVNQFAYETGESPSSASSSQPQSEVYTVDMSGETKATSSLMPMLVVVGILYFIMKK